MSRHTFDRVPLWVWILLITGVSVQVTFHSRAGAVAATAESLPPAPRVAMAKSVALGEPIAVSKLLMMWLQIFDNQPGVSVPFQRLDYERVQDWLRLIQELDPRSQYPMLAAARVYAQVADKAKQRMMTEFIYDHFFSDPQRRWPWLAHAAVLAKHRLRDNELALKYARAIADISIEVEIPAWASQMEIFLLEDVGELESARLLIGGLLTGGQITDKQEILFLREQLERLERLSQERN